MEEGLPERGNVTEMLKAWSDGNRGAAESFMPLVYEELRRQAHRYLYRERRNHTLQTTGLVHEAYLRLVDQRDVTWQNRAHFFAIAAQMMRRILIDYAIRRNRLKRGGTSEDVTLDDALGLANKEKSIDLLSLDEALTRLEQLDEQQARIVELRYFSGLSVEETAEVLGKSASTVKRDWAMAKAWLKGQLS